MSLTDPRFGNRIYFIRNPEEVNSKKEFFSFGIRTAKRFTLYDDKSYFFEVLNFLPKDFTLTTKNGKSSKFNLRFLQNTSSVIEEFHKENPNVMEYHVDVDDKDNILDKFEKLYSGETVYFDEEELPISKKITSLLNITCCPNYMKPENLKSDEASQEKNLGLDAGVGMSKKYFYMFVRINTPSFTISTKKNKYQCNYYGVISSKVIRDFIIKNPDLSQYEYDFDDDNNDFQQICNIFNFISVDITSNNMEILKEIAEDLQIDTFLPLIEKNINEYEKVSQMIDEQQNTIDSIEDLFGWLYNIEELTVESVKTSILNSNWIKTEDDIHELAAFFIEVINSQFKLHPYLIDLLIQIDKESDETSQSKNLLPFVVKMLLISNGSSLPICSFIYNLYKRGIISKEDLNDFLIEKINLSINKQIWFLPEIIELGKSPALLVSNNNFKPFSSTAFFNKSGFSKKPLLGNKPGLGNKTGFGFGNSNNNLAYQNFAKCYYPEKIDLFKKMRDSGEPEDELTRSLRIDDVDKVQSILTSGDIDFSTYTLPFNIFEKLKENGEIKLIDYAAAYGSVKCFKYLMLNHSEINALTFSNAVRGGNIEIIKTVFQQFDPIQQPVQQPRGAFGFGTKPINVYIDDISPAIENHQNDLFDWIFEQKYSSNLNERADALLKQSAKCGNAHALIEIIDKCATTCNFKNLIYEASKNGFYKLANMIFDIKSKRSADFDNNFSGFIMKNPDNDILFQGVDFVYFDNLSIFKIGIKLHDFHNLFTTSLCFCINNDYKRIFDCYCDELFKNETSFLRPSNLLDALIAAINKKSDYYFKHMIEQIKLVKPDFFACFSDIDVLLQEACSKAKFDDIKLILEVIKENKLEVDITQSFILAAQSGSIEICQYIFDQKLKIDFEEIILSNDTKFSKEIYSLILDKMDPEMNEIFLYYSLTPAISNDNKELVEFLLSKNVHYDDALIVAAQNSDIDMINIILKHDSSPSFVNKVSLNGTALIIAINNNRLETTKRLLSIPGIDLNLYEKNDQTPLISSIVNLNIDILNVILEFYGEKIQSEIWQIDKAIKMTLSRLSGVAADQSNIDFNNMPTKTFGATKPFVNGNNKFTKTGATRFGNNFGNWGSGNNFGNFNIGINDTNSIEKRKSRLLTIVKRILEIKNIDPNSRGGEHTLLSYACEVNEIDIVQLLLQDERIDVNAYAPISGNTPLMIAILNENVEIAKILINDKRTDINTRNYSNKTSLTFAVTKQLEEIVNLLIKNDKFDPVKSNISYAFYLSKSKSITQILVDQKSVDINYQCINYNNQNKSSPSNFVKRCRYETPLTNAVANCDIDKINLIIQNPSFDRNKSLLILSIFDSISVDSIPIFRLLLKLIDDDINIKLNNNMSLLTAAVKCSQDSFVSEILNNKNFDSEKSDIIESFKECFCGENDLSDIASEIYNYDAQNKHLIDLNKPLSNGETFLTSLSFNGKRIDYTQLLFDLGADPNIPNKNGFYPLELAMYCMDIDQEYLMFLLDSNRIDLNQQIPIKNNDLIRKTIVRIINYDDNDDFNIAFNTPSNSKYFSYIHLAALLQNPCILESLLRKGVDINIKDDQGNTPLFYASLNRLNDNIDVLFNDENLDYLHCNNDGYDAIGILDKSKDHPKSKKDFEAKLLSFSNMNYKKATSKFGAGFNSSSLYKQPVKKKSSLSETAKGETNQLNQKTTSKLETDSNSSSLNKQPVEKKSSLSEAVKGETNQLNQKTTSKFGAGFNSSSLNKQPVEKKSSLSEAAKGETNRLNQKTTSKFGAGFNSSSLNKLGEKKPFSSKAAISNNNNIKSSPNEVKNVASSSLNQSDTNNQNGSAAKSAFSSLSSSFTKQQIKEDSAENEEVKTISESLKFEDVMRDDNELIQNQYNDYQCSLISAQQYQQYQQQWQQLMQISYASQMQFNMQMMQMQSLLNTKQQVTKKKTKSKSKNKKKSKK